MYEGVATSGLNEAVATSDAALILGTGAANTATDRVFGFGGDRIPAGQYGIASTLTVVPR